MNNMLIAIILIFLVLAILTFIYLRKKNKQKSGMDGTNKPPEDIYPMY